MDMLILYDSAYGNTEKIAQAMARAVTRPDSARVFLVRDPSLPDIQAADIIIVGSPTQGGRPTEDIQNYLNNLPPDVLVNKLVAAFDTRFGINEHGFGLKLLMKTIGFAAPRIAASLKAKGGRLVIAPEGFIVEDKEGPLRAHEVERAASWIQKIKEQVKQRSHFVS